MNPTLPITALALQAADYIVASLPATARRSNNAANTLLQYVTSR